MALFGFGQPAKDYEGDTRSFSLRNMKPQRFPASAAAKPAAKPQAPAQQRLSLPSMGITPQRTMPGANPSLPKPPPVQQQPANPYAGMFQQVNQAAAQASAPPAGGGGGFKAPAPAPAPPPAPPAANPYQAMFDQVNTASQQAQQQQPMGAIAGAFANQWGQAGGALAGAGAGDTNLAGTTATPTAGGVGTATSSPDPASQVQPEQQAIPGTEPIGGVWGMDAALGIATNSSNPAEAAWSTNPWAVATSASNQSQMVRAIADAWANGATPADAVQQAWTVWGGAGQLPRPMLDAWMELAQRAAGGSNAQSAGGSAESMQQIFFTLLQAPDSPFNRSMWSFAQDVYSNVNPTTGIGATMGTGYGPEDVQQLNQFFSDMLNAGAGPGGLMRIGVPEDVAQQMAMGQFPDPWASTPPASGGPDLSGASFGGGGGTGANPTGDPLRATRQGPAPTGQKLQIPGGGGPSILGGGGIPERQRTEQQVTVGTDLSGRGGLGWAASGAGPGGGWSLEGIGGGSVEGNVKDEMQRRKDEGSLGDLYYYDRQAQGGDLPPGWNPQSGTAQPVGEAISPNYQPTTGAAPGSVGGSLGLPGGPTPYQAPQAGVPAQYQQMFQDQNAALLQQARDAQTLGGRALVDQMARQGLAGSGAVGAGMADIGAQVQQQYGQQLLEQQQQQAGIGLQAEQNALQRAGLTEQARQYDAGFGLQRAGLQLDQAQFGESQRQFNASLQQRGVEFNAGLEQAYAQMRQRPELARLEAQLQQQMQAAQLAGELDAAAQMASLQQYMAMQYSLWADSLGPDLGEQVLLSLMGGMGGIAQGLGSVFGGYYSNPANGG